MPDPQDRQPMKLRIPLVGSNEVIEIAGTFRITGEQWDHFMAILEAMKPGLVAAPPEGDRDA